MADDNNRQPVILAYGLCASAGAGFCFNLIVLVWFSVRSTNIYSVGSLQWRTVEWITRLLTVTYICDGASLTALVLHRDLDSKTLCTIAGHILLCSLQISLWLLAIIAVLFACTTCRQSYSRNKHRLVVGVTCAVLTAVIISAFLSFFPLIRRELLNNNADDSYYRCIPLRSPETQSGPYWLLVVVSMWLALAVNIFALVVAFVKLSRTNSKRRSPLDTTILARRTFVVISINCALWSATVVVASVGYISSEHWLDREQSEWVLGYIISGIILLYPALTLTLANCRKTVPPSSSSSSPSEQFWQNPPKCLQSLRRDDATSQGSDVVHRYIISWRNKDGHYASGTMKVFKPNAQYKWRNEMAAMKKLCQSQHRNIAQYLWHSSHNNYSASIRAFTNDVIPHDASVICRRHYSNGTLDNFLQTSMFRLTEVALHKLTVDIASGLAYIHQHNIVHNCLSTHTILIASASGKSGLCAVISDFENSYDVSRETAFSRESGMPALAGSADLFTISRLTEQQTRLGSVFAADIRSFGRVVLQMLLKLSEYNSWKDRHTTQEPQRHSQQQQQQQQHSSPHRLHNRQAPPRAPPLALPHLSAHSLSQCNCSQAVTDIRVHGDEWNCAQFDLPDRIVQQSTPSTFSDSPSMVSTCSPDDRHAADNHCAQSFDNANGKHDGDCADAEEYTCINNNTQTDVDLEYQGSELTTNEYVAHDKEDGEFHECQREHVTAYVDDACSTSVASLASFETIYEDGSYLQTTNDVCNTSDKRRTRPYLRRTLPIGMTGRQWTTGSVDGSLHSTDSGIGCSELAFQCTAQRDFANTPGNRGTIYSTNSSVSGHESYSALSDFFDRAVQSPIYFDNRLWDGRSRHPAFTVDTKDNYEYARTKQRGEINLTRQSGYKREHLNHISTTNFARDNHEYMDVSKEHWHPNKWLRNGQITNTCCAGENQREMSPASSGLLNVQCRQPRRSVNVPSLGIAALARKRADGCSCWQQNDSQTDKNYARETCNCNAAKKAASLSLSRASVSSSVMSIINDSRLILSASDVSEIHDTDHESASKTESPNCQASATINVSSYQIKDPERSRNKTQKDTDSHKGINYEMGLDGQSEINLFVNELNRSGLLYKNASTSDAREHWTQTSNSEICLQNLTRDDEMTTRLAYTAGKLLPLLSDCWKDKPSLSARDIICRLSHLLPAAPV